MGGMRIAASAAMIAGTLLVSACSGQAAAPSGGAPATGATPAEELARTKCTMCHTFDRVAQAEKSAAEWESTVDRMVGHGLVLTNEERATITEYLNSK